MASEHELHEVAPFSSRRSATIQLCNLIGRRLRERFVSEKHHLPLNLRILRTTLAVCRAQTMSFHFKPKYSLRHVPVVSANANTGPCDVVSAAFSNVRTCSSVNTRISFLGCCGRTLLAVSLPSR